MHSQILVAIDIYSYIKFQKNMQEKKNDFFSIFFQKKRFPAKIAANFVVESIKATLGDKDHWYGVKFEKAIPCLIKLLEK